MDLMVTLLHSSLTERTNPRLVKNSLTSPRVPGVNDTAIITIKAR